MMRRRPRQFRAFTLLELILAMTMVAVLSVSLYATMTIAYRAKRSAERVIRPIRAASIAADLISRDLGSVVLPSPTSTAVALDPTDTTLFLAGAFIGTSENGGDAGWMEFCCNGSDGTPGDIPLSEGIRRIDIGLRSDVTPPVLVRRITRNLLSPVAEDPEEEVICRNVKSFTLRYFDGTDWTDTWDSTVLNDVNAKPAIPMLVEMTLVLNIPGETENAQDTTTYTITRLVPLACATAVDPTQSTGTTTP